MKVRAVLMWFVVVGLTAVGAAAGPPAEGRLAVGETPLVLDGGDLEAMAAPGLEPSILASLAAQEAAPPPAAQAPPSPRPMAFEYSDGYRTRLKIHKYASFAMLPLFVAQYAVGQKLYDGNASDSTRSAHSALAAGTAVLFGVNTVTGVWNLSEGRKDPNHRTKRMVHGILMAVADAGFVATGALAPENEEGHSSGNRSTHRTVALTSMGVATVAYLMMLFH
jgi:hypothetical protein